MFYQKGKKYPVEILTQDELYTLLKTFKPTWYGLRNRALVSVLVGGQLRINEALDLRACDVNLIQGSITVQLGKGKRRRVVGIMQFVRTYIGVWDRMRPESPYYFCKRSGGRIDNSYVRHMLKRLQKKIGTQKRLHPHQMRHVGACMLAEAGVSVRTIMRQLGHSSLQTTQVYLDHLLPEDVINEVGGVYPSPRYV